MPAGSVFMPFAYVEAAANILTNPRLDPFGKIPEYKFCAVKLRAATVEELEESTYGAASEVSAASGHPAHAEDGGGTAEEGLDVRS
jgi:formate dehydrogenase major subunit